MQEAAALFSTMAEYPLPSILLFLLVLLIAYSAVAGRRRASGVVSILRVFATVFSTPFEFLRNSIGTIDDAHLAEKDYAGTREFVVFRYSRILYLGVLLFALTYLSAGVTSGILTFIPRYEMQQAAALRAQVETLTNEINAASSAAPSANNSEALSRAANQANAAYQAQLAAQGQLRAQITVNSGEVALIENAQDVPAVQNILNSLPGWFADCPTGPTWQNFSVPLCDQFRTQLTGYAKARIKTLNLAVAAAAASSAAAGAAASDAQQAANLAQETANLGDLQQQLRQIDPANGAWIAGHFRASVWIILTTVGTLIVWIWVWAIVIDVINWLILLMRSLEKEHAARLAATPSQPSPEPSAAAG